MPVAEPLDRGRTPQERDLGRLGPALAFLATAQGAWPPRTPTAVRRVVVHDADGGLEQGVALADEIADGGGDLVVLSADAEQTTGIVVVAALLDLEPVQAVGTVGSADWAGLIAGVRDGLRTARDHLADPHGLLDATASPALSVTTGLLAQCAVRRTPVLLDGSPLVCGAALVAERLAPGGAAWWLAGQAPPNPAAARALADLGLVPLLDLQLATPLGGDVALGVLLQAVEAVRPSDPVRLDGA